MSISSRGRITCSRCGQKKAWSLRQRHSHKCPHGAPCETRHAGRGCPKCRARRLVLELQR